MKTDLLGLSPAAVASAISGVAPEPYRAAQVMRWIYERRTSDFSLMTDLPQGLRERLAGSHTVAFPRVAERTPAEDGALKLLLELADGVRVEAVHIPGTGRGGVTVCLSSQAGCAVNCAFCVTGRMGAGRNLTAGEIVGQYLVIARETGIAPREANVVFMGMGEPLLNVPNVEGALDLLEREVSVRRTTVSTAGVVPGIDALSAREKRPNLAVSLSAPSDDLRTRLMPINATWPIEDLFSALSRWPLERGRKITFEYVLIAGQNDGAPQARALARLVARVPSKVNLIPLNESERWLPGLRRPSELVVETFAKTLAGAGVDTTVRRSKGLGAEAACGQLKGRHEPLRARPGPSRRPAAPAAPLERRHP